MGRGELAEAEASQLSAGCAQLRLTAVERRFQVAMLLEIRESATHFRVAFC